MIIAKVKPLEEVKEMIKEYRKILNVGCAGCTAICLAGGQKEVDTLNAKLSISFKSDKGIFSFVNFRIVFLFSIAVFKSMINLFVSNHSILLNAHSF